MAKPRLKVEVYQDTAGEWRWNVRHDNGKILADSGEGYATLQGANRAFLTLWGHMNHVIEWQGKDTEYGVRLSPSAIL